MNTKAAGINNIKVEQAFSAQSLVFDELYGADPMIGYKRARVRAHMLQYAASGGSMLELNCGTGEDAIYFAKKGFTVHATDLSAGMLHQLKQKAEQLAVSGRLTFEQCSFDSLQQLGKRDPFDYIYSNFGGLNCTGHLKEVLKELTFLVKPGGYITLVIISRFCLWETLLAFKGKFRTAFRRFFSKDGRKARVENQEFKCWYYSSSYVSKLMERDFDTVATEGLCTIVPPSYIEGFAQKYPRLFAFLSRQEDKRKSSFPWREMGDYFVITLRRK